MTATLAVMGCAKEPFEKAGVTSRHTDDGMSFNAILESGTATRSDYSVHKFDTPDGRTVEMEEFLLPMSSATMSDEEMEPMTKAAPVDNMYSSFSFVANGISETVARRSDDGRYYADGGAKFSDMPTESAFFCWGPLEAPGVNYDETVGKLSYVTPEDVINQKDLLVSRSAVISPSNMSPVKLTFKHALAGVQVKAAEIFPSSTVKKVTLKGVYKNGTYDPETGEWTVDPSSIGDLELLTSAVNGVTQGSEIASGDYTAMIVPQQFSSSSEIEVVLNYRSLDYKYVAPIGGKTIPAGTIIVFSVDGRSMWLFEGTANANFTITQYAHVNAVAKLADIEIDETGHFSVLLPAPKSDAYHYLFKQYKTTDGSNLPTKANTEMLTITHLPDILSSFKNWDNMFNYCTALTEIPPFPKTDRVTSISGLFANCSQLEHIDLSDVDFSEVTDFHEIFAGCTKLQEGPIMDTRSGTDFRSMFYNCKAMTSIPCYDLSKGTRLDRMFGQCNHLTAIPPMDFTKATNMMQTFSDCWSLVSMPTIDIPSCTNLQEAFYNCASLTTDQIKIVNSNRVTIWQDTFYLCKAMTRVPWMDTSAATNFQGTFMKCYSLTSVDDIDTGKVTNFRSCFQECTALVDSPALDTHSGTNFMQMFYECNNLVNVYAYDTSNGRLFMSMFNSCTKLKNVPLLNLRNARNSTGATPYYACGRMFMNCSSLETLPPFEIGVDSGTIAVSCEYMCQGTSSLSTFPEFDLTNVTSMYHMFYGSGITSVPSLDVPRCSSFEAAFYGASKLETVTDLSLPAATNIKQLFMNCSKLAAAPAIDAPLVSGGNANELFNGCSVMETVSTFNMPNITSFYRWFKGCYKLKSCTTLPVVSELKNIADMFACAYGGGALETLQEIDATSVTSTTDWMKTQAKLVNFGGLKDMKTSFNMSLCTLLSHDSLMNIINKLADVTDAETAPTCNLGATNLAKLTDEEKAIATGKGWNLI